MKSQRGWNCIFGSYGVIEPLDPLAPCIEWKILLPTQWNLRSVQIGGGANNGMIPSLEGAMLMSDYCPIEHGYVVFGDDSGISLLILCLLILQQMRRLFRIISGII